MKLGDVTAKNYPKMTLIAAPRAGGSISHPQLHPARLPRRDRRAGGGDGRDRLRARGLGHPGYRRGAARLGARRSRSSIRPASSASRSRSIRPNPQNVTRAALLRTARLLMRGEAMVPGSVWAGHVSRRFQRNPVEARASGRTREETMIIDVHGHYTTAPKALEDWRNRQIAGIKDPSAMPKASELKISDDELREIDRRQPAEEDAGARQRPHHLLAARQLHGAPHRRLPGVVDLGRDLQRAVLRASRSCSPTASSARRCCRSRPASTRRPASPSWRSASRSTASSASTSIPTRRAGTGRRRRCPTGTGTRSTRRWSSSTSRR